MFGTVPEPEGITDPPIDDPLEKVDSKYTLSTYAAQRARQINSCHQEMTRGDGNITTFGSLVEVNPEDKPLSIALEEIREGKVEWTTERD